MISKFEVGGRGKFKGERRKVKVERIKAWCFVAWVLTCGAYHEWHEFHEFAWVDGGLGCGFYYREIH